MKKQDNLVEKLQEYYNDLNKVHIVIQKDINDSTDKFWVEQKLKYVKNSLFYMIRKIKNGGKVVKSE